MGIKISEAVKKHIILWDENRDDLLLKEYEESTLNPITNEYDMVLVDTKKVGGADYANMIDFSSSTITTITSSNTWYILSTSTTAPYLKGFTHSNNRLTKVDNTYGVIKAEGCISVSAGNNDDIDVSFYKNGNIIPSSQQHTVTSSGGKPTSIPFHCMVEMNDGDYLEVWVNNVNAANNITLYNLNVILTEMT